MSSRADPPWGEPDCSQDAAWGQCEPHRHAASTSRRCPLPSPSAVNAWHREVRTHGRRSRKVPTGSVSADPSRRTAPWPVPATGQCQSWPCDDERVEFLGDVSSNVSTRLESGGDSIEQHTFSPYAVLTIHHAARSRAGSAPSADVAYTHTGTRLDGETGLYYYRHRMMHAQLGRFITRDQSGYDWGRVSLQQHVNSSPTYGSDPLGLFLTEGPLDMRKAQGASGPPTSGGGGIFLFDGTPRDPGLNFIQEVVVKGTFSCCAKDDKSAEVEFSYKYTELFRLRSPNGRYRRVRDWHTNSPDHSIKCIGLCSGSCDWTKKWSFDATARFTLQTGWANQLVRKGVVVTKVTAKTQVTCFDGTEHQLDENSKNPTAVMDMYPGKKHPPGPSNPIQPRVDPRSMKKTDTDTWSCSGAGAWECNYSSTKYN